MHCPDPPHLPSPVAILRQIQDLFRRLGIFGETLNLELEGTSYQIRCDEGGLVIYRLLPPRVVPPGAPGWPVCLVTPTTMSDECSPPHHEEDHFAAALSLADWLEIIEQYYSTDPSASDSTGN